MWLRKHWKFALRTLLSINFVVLVWLSLVPWYILGPWVTLVCFLAISSDWRDENRIVVRGGASQHGMHGKLIAKHLRRPIRLPRKG